VNVLVKEYEMRKPKKAEMITLAEMARLAGVSKPAVAAFIHRQEEAGACLVTTSGRRTKTVDKNNPVISRYIDNKTAQPGNRDGGKPPTQAALEKLKEQTEKQELAAAALRAKYVDRAFALRFLDEVLEMERRELAAMVDRILKQLAAELAPVSPGQMKTARRLLEQPCADALEMSHRIVAQVRKETTAPDAGGKHEKCKPLSRR
jgi:hypothetical protein